MHRGKVVVSFLLGILEIRHDFQMCVIRSGWKGEEMRQKFGKEIEREGER